VTGAPSVDSNSDIVSFTAASEPECVVTPDDSWWAWWSEAVVPDSMARLVKDQVLTPVFKSLALPHIDTFALASLLFPSAHVVQLKDAALPKDLYLTGTLMQPITVTPANSMLTPGGKIQFSATGLPKSPSDILWEINPQKGCISPTGLYTAPSALSSAEVVVVTVKNLKTNSDGRAMVLVYKSPAAEGVAVMPGRSLVTPGQQVQLSTTDTAAKPVSVTWTLSPNIGQITSGWTKGQYYYAAPTTVSVATEVAVTAVNASDRTQTGTVVIQVTPSTRVAVQPAQASSKLGASVA